MRTAMSDTFAFRSLPVPLRRRVDRRVVKAAVACCLVVAAIGVFARWTIRSEHASLAASAHHEAASNIGTVQGSDVGVSVVGLPTSGIVTIPAADLAAQDVVRDTLSRTQRMVGLRALTEAGPGQLARDSEGVTYTDGPSMAPSIVSVAATNAAWGAAAMSESGLCFAVRLDAAGAARFGTLSSACTGAGALQVTGSSW
jgi:hypothetical protein